VDEKAYSFASANVKLKSKGCFDYAEQVGLPAGLPAVRTSAGRFPVPEAELLCFKIPVSPRPATSRPFSEHLSYISGTVGVNIVRPFTIYIRVIRFE